MPAGIAIPIIMGASAAASTGATIYAAKKGSQAATNAANAQLQASNNALNYQQGIYGQLMPMAQQGMANAQSAYAPYQRLGNSALDALYSRLGLSPGTLQGQPWAGATPPQIPPPMRQPVMTQTPWQKMTGQPIPNAPLMGAPAQPIPNAPMMGQPGQPIPNTPYGPVRQPLGVYGSQ